MWEKKPNFMAVGWINRVNHTPPLIGLSIGKGHLSVDSILECNSFSVSFPSTDLVVKTDHCGIVSGKDIDQSEVFDVFYGELENTPMIRESTLSMECRLEIAIDQGSNYLYRRDSGVLLGGEISYRE